MVSAQCSGQGVVVGAASDEDCNTSLLAGIITVKNTDAGYAGMTELFAAFGPQFQMWIVFAVILAALVG